MGPVPLGVVFDRINRIYRIFCVVISEGDSLGFIGWPLARQLASRRQEYKMTRGHTKGGKMAANGSQLTASPC